jgi:phenylalanine-4-hydroxylase
MRNEDNDGSAPLEDFSRYLSGENPEGYGSAAQEVWREVLRRNDELVRTHENWIHPAYLEGLRRLALPSSIPRTEELNARLEPTGWRVVSVIGYLPTAAYGALVATNVLPVSREIRRAEHIDFAPAPDMVHDVLGHLPLLFSPQFRRYLKTLAHAMVKAAANSLDQELYEAVTRMAELKGDPLSAPSAVAAAEARVERVTLALADNASEATALRRLYVWSVEFGMLGDSVNARVHGAALLSSPAEFHACRAPNATTLPYSLQVVDHENSFSELLPRYFVAREFAHYGDVLTEYEAMMKFRQHHVPASDVRELEPTVGERSRRHA